MHTDDIDVIREIKMNEMFEKLTESNDVEVKRSPLETVLKSIF